MEQPTPSIDISKITDVNVLKGLAYDRLALQQRTANELGMLNARIAELGNAQASAMKDAD